MTPEQPIHTLRENYTALKRFAASILDRARKNDPAIDEDSINEALATLGEPI